MSIEPKILKRGPLRYAGICERLARNELSEVVPRTLSELIAFLRRHRVPIIGAPLLRYLVVDYNTGEVEVDVGVPIGAAILSVDNRVHPAQIPAGTFATVIHRGSYEGLMKTTAALLDWGKEKNVNWEVVEEGKVTRWTARVESYQVGPPEDPDPETWQTEIAILIAASQASGHLQS